MYNSLKCSFINLFLVWYWSFVSSFVTQDQNQSHHDSSRLVLLHGTVARPRLGTGFPHCFCRRYLFFSLSSVLYNHKLRELFSKINNYIRIRYYFIRNLKFITTSFHWSAQYRLYKIGTKLIYYFSYLDASVRI